MLLNMEGQLHITILLCLCLCCLSVVSVCVSVSACMCMCSWTLGTASSYGDKVQVAKYHPVRSVWEKVTPFEQPMLSIPSAACVLNGKIYVTGIITVCKGSQLVVEEILCFLLVVIVAKSECKNTVTPKGPAIYILLTYPKKCYFLSNTHPTMP